MKRQVQRIRHKSRPYLATPTNREDLILPKEFKRTWKNEEFLVYDNEGKNRTMIFSTAKNLDLLSTCKVIVCDGTFFSVPQIFAQLYSVHGLADNGKTLPLVYVLSPDRTRKTYKSILSVICDLAPDLNPETILVDFEKPFINAASEIFPDADIGSCNFHFNQCI